MPSPQTIRARKLRRAQTPPERALWKLLRAHQMQGFGFRRQHPIDRFFADFACPAANSSSNSMAVLTTAVSNKTPRATNIFKITVGQHRVFPIQI